jgi:ubiquinone/menaquinone biosynthesis C-methylase UbiE
MQDERKIRDFQSKTYHLQRTSYHTKLWLDAVNKYLKIKWRDKVLDAGCGVGLFLIPLAKKCREIFGVDFSLKSLTLLKNEISNLQFKNAKILCADVTHIPLPSEYFDKIMLIEVLQHIPTHQLRVKTINELYRILRPKGILLIMAYRFGGFLKRKEAIKKTEHGLLYRHGFTSSELHEILDLAGFKEIHIGGIINFKPRGVKYLGLFLRKLDIVCSFLNISQNKGKYLIATGAK